MAAAAARKLQKEIETTLKKVDDGIEEFDILWEEAQDAATTASQREKIGDELKQKINKLQRFRVQIREWIAANEVKAKDKLEAARKRIEYNMQRFKEFERELKTKAYSTFALAKDEEEDSESAERREHQNWCSNMISGLNDSIEIIEADIETLQGKKSVNKDDLEEKKKHIERHRWHILKLESLLRAMDNDSVQDYSQVTEIKESVEYYLEAFSEPEYYHDECLYDAFDLVIQDYTHEMEVAASKNVDEKATINMSINNKAKAKKAALGLAKKATLNPAMQSATTVVVKKKRSEDDGEQKISEDQVVPSESNNAEEFICKICYVHIVGCQPKLTKCSHLFCGDCLAQWFEQHPEIQTWAQRAKTAGGQEHTVPCPVCKTPLVEKRDLDPVCSTASRSENLLLWRMLSSLKIMCINHAKVTPGLGPGNSCTWVGEYGEYQDHIRECKSEGNPLVSNSVAAGSAGSQDHIKSDSTKSEGPLVAANGSANNGVNTSTDKDNNSTPIALPNPEKKTTPVAVPGSAAKTGPAISTNSSSTTATASTTNQNQNQLSGSGPGSTGDTGPTPTPSSAKKEKNNSNKSKDIINTDSEPASASASKERANGNDKNSSSDKAGTTTSGTATSSTNAGTNDSSSDASKNQTKGAGATGSNSDTGQGGPGGDSSSKGSESGKNSSSNTKNSTVNSTKSGVGPGPGPGSTTGSATLGPDGKSSVDGTRKGSSSTTPSSSTKSPKVINDSVNNKSPRGLASNSQGGKSFATTVAAASSASSNADSSIKGQGAQSQVSGGNSNQNQNSMGPQQGLTKNQINNASQSMTQSQTSTPQINNPNIIGGPSGPSRAQNNGTTILNQNQNQSQQVVTTPNINNTTGVGIKANGVNTKGGPGIYNDSYPQGPGGAPGAPHINNYMPNNNTNSNIINGGPNANTMGIHGPGPGTPLQNGNLGGGPSSHDSSSTPNGPGGPNGNNIVNNQNQNLGGPGSKNGPIQGQPGPGGPGGQQSQMNNNQQNNAGQRAQEYPIGLAKAAFEPRGENTIQVQAGHKLKIIEEHNSGWTFVKNDDTQESGWVPAWVVSRERPAIQRPPPAKVMKALANFEGNSENELTIAKGEWLNVVERHETGWTFGKKKDANTDLEYEGWFPDWVIQTPSANTVF